MWSSRRRTRASTTRTRLPRPERARSSAAFRSLAASMSPVPSHRAPISRFREGDQVLVTGYDLGVANDGGYAGYVRVPADWVVADAPRSHGVRGDGAWHRRLHRGSVHCASRTERPPAAERHGGRHRIDRRCRQHCCRSVSRALGYDVTAITGKDDAHDYLRQLGAREVLSRTHARDGNAAAREGALGWRGRRGGRRHAGVADAHDRRVGQHRQHRTDGRRGACTRP